MKPKLHYIFLVVILTASTVVSQNEDELHIPVETDNHFPPDHLLSESFIEGSGDGVVDEPSVDVTTEFTLEPKIESVEGSRLLIDEEPVQNSDSNSTELPCPKPCVCNIEGGTTNYTVDCSGYGLSEFPSPIDVRTTTLKLHNNKLTEIPKTVSELKNLKVLNANNNLIMELASGSVSELPQLEVLKLGNNRLIEYPKDLQNSISLLKLEELDLGGNDMRTTLSSENFSNFKALRKITLPAGSSSNIALDLCGSLKNTLEAVCTESCAKNLFECPEAPQIIEEDLLDATLPGMIAFDTILEGEINADKEIENSAKESVSSTATTSKSPEITSTSKDTLPVNEFSLRTAMNSAPAENIALHNVISETVNESSSTETSVKVGAKTAETKSSGGVDKGVIGIVVAGMIVVVAGITIKKNWSSIRKRFNSTPNRAADRQDTNGNATIPEEVPLQDKSDKSPV